MHNKYFKFSKKHLERQFSLGMILLYCIKHTNHHTVSPIIAMLNWFLRNLGDSTQVERDSIDHVEYKLLNNEVGDIQFFEDLIDDNLSEQTGDDQGKCFKFVNEFIMDKVAAVVNSFYHGEHADLALIEVALYDHGQLRKRNSHTAFVNTLVAWGLIIANDAELNQIISGIKDKYKRLPVEGYKEWDDIFLNDRNRCIEIGKLLGSTMKYQR